MVNNSIPLTIVIGIGSFFIALITIIILIARKKFLENTIRVGIISKGGHIERTRIKRKNIKKTIKIGNKRYEYIPSAEVTTWRGKEIYYPKESTKPIFFNQDNKIDNDKSNIDPENLNAIIETELIAKLFKKEILNTENVLLFVILVCSVVSVIMLFIILNQGVVLKDNPANKELIENAVRNVLENI